MIDKKTPEIGYDGIKHRIWNPAALSEDVIGRFHQMCSRFPHDNSVVVVYFKNSEVAAYPFPDHVEAQYFQVITQQSPFCGHCELYNLDDFRKLRGY